MGGWLGEGIKGKLLEVKWRSEGLMNRPFRIMGGVYYLYMYMYMYMYMNNKFLIGWITGYWLSLRYMYIWASLKDKPNTSKTSPRHWVSTHPIRYVQCTCNS